MKVRTITCSLMIMVLTGWLLSMPMASPAAARQTVTASSSTAKNAVQVVFTGELEMQQHTTFHLFHVDNPPRLGIDFPDATFKANNIAEHLPQTLFEGCRYQTYPDKTRLVFDTNEAQLPNYTFSASGKELQLSFPVANNTAAKKPAAKPVVKTSSRRQYRPSAGKNLITADFKDADLQNVFRFLADIKHMNLIMGEDVQGTVTIKLKEVPWQQAFNILLKTNKLGMERDGNVIRIAPLSRFKEEKEALAQNKKANETLAETELAIVKVNFAQAADIAPRLTAILSDRGSIDTDQRTNTLIIKDLPRYIEGAKNLLQQLDMPIKQVLIEAKIVKIETDAVKDIGIQWGGVWGDRDSDHYYGVTGNNGTTGLPSITPEPSIASNYVVNLPASGATSGLGMIFGKVGVFNLNLRLTALKNNHLANILSTPKVLALDNHKARIGQGVEIPYQTTSQDGTTTEFKKAELSLEVVPHITNNDNVSMEVKINKDSIGVQTSDGPAINTQAIETTLLLFNGETAVVGGIIEKDKTSDENEVPGFSEVPLLGDLLFKQKYNKNSQTELLIFITPTVIPLQTSSNF
ncbi:MAG: type IV pilus secretin PilQ [Deltaproteobacteria bacterium]|nr:type IV pilus secretin PilQ [Candidatus Anaeroferrophillus wilburensis]MBN2888101.1 type IV pilus secretin PilQ [Deltaproteobacteria bacterium]